MIRSVRQCKKTMNPPKDKLKSSDRSGHLFGRSRKEILKVWVPVSAACILLLIATWALFVGPAPPKVITIATGSKSGAYYQYAQRYGEILERDYDIDLRVKETRGSGDNLRLLMDAGSGVDTAFVQSGLVKSGAAPEGADATLSALGSMYREPLWVFHRGSEPLRYLHELAGKRVAIGAKGSGTRAVAKALFESNGQSIGDMHIVGVASSSEAVDGLFARTIDTVFIVASPTASYVQRVVEAMGGRDPADPESLQLLSFRRATSYTRAHRWLSHLEITEGLLDLPGNVPDRDVDVVAPSAMLVASEDLHPSLVTVMLDVAEQVHAEDRGNVLDTPGEFPTKAYVDLPVQNDAKRYYEHGKSFFYKVLPFWVANTIDRLKVMLLPLLTLLFPLFKVAPPVLRWRIRSRIYQWYEVIREADVLITSGASIERLEEEHDKLLAIEADLPNTEVPLSYMEEFYDLRIHMDFIHTKLEEALAERKSRAPSERGE